MKSLILLFVIFVSVPGMTQKIVTQPGSKRADLAIREVRVIEATRNPATGLHKVKVAVTIMNRGEAPSGNTTLKMLVQNQLLNAVAPQHNQPANPWHQLGSNQPVASIAPGKSFAAEYLFTEASKVISTSRFNMGLIADGGDILKESDENDNRSVQLEIQPQDRIEYVALTPTVQVTAKLDLPDTFQYTIGRGDFRLQLREKTSIDIQNFFQTFLRITPQGVVVKKFGGDGIPRNVTLIAPLHLPEGAVIRKVKFNYQKLAGTTELVPHLVLRSHHQNTENEGWGLNTPITSYWVNSPSRDGIGGYRIMSSITNPGFNAVISKGSTYFFEILGADARSTHTPDTSEWPADDKIFIWSIQVFYTLK